tara:strand:+ start:19336 stop:20517 length:1182 start_codon:yes stop_codon:yes gene_type:complete
MPTPLNKLEASADEHSPLQADEAPSKLEDGIGLCLSGGGFRAMIFHLGALIRLNELGLLEKINRFSSVSGGSITNAWLGLQWYTLKSDHFSKESLLENVVEPICSLADHTIDYSAVGWGVINPWSDISEEVANAYDDKLFASKSLQDLPDEPRFVINATNVKTGSIWRFSKPYMADYRIGMIMKPDLPIATAVAGSSAFPPFLSPLRIPLDGFKFKPGIPQKTSPTLKHLRTDAVLTDGGVYDNLGLETVYKRYKTVLISDGGQNMADDLNPKDDWARHSRRLIDLLQHQVCSLRRRIVIEDFLNPEDPHQGAYWGIHTDIANYKLSNALKCDFGKTTDLARIDTRLGKLKPIIRQRLMNWGYAVCDAAIRKHLPDPSYKKPSDFPFPQAGLG